MRRAPGQNPRRASARADEEAAGERFKHCPGIERQTPLSVQRRRRVGSVVGMCHDIDADTEDEPIEGRVGAGFRFEQDPGEFSAIEQDIVGPFAAQFGERRRAVADRIAEPERRNEAELIGVRRRASRPQDHRDEKIAGQSDPLTAAPAASGRLLACPDDGPVLCPCARQSLRLVIGAR